MTTRAFWHIKCAEKMAGLSAVGEACIGSNHSPRLCLRNLRTETIENTGYLRKPATSANTDTITERRLADPIHTGHSARQMCFVRYRPDNCLNNIQITGGCPEKSVI